MTKLSDFVVRFIAEHDVRHVFLVTGGAAMHLNESLSRCREIEAVCNSHEQASAIAAEVYGKATNRLGVALVTAGPGGTNAITGLAGAWLDSTPCLFISGQVKRADRMIDSQGRPIGVRQLGIQELDIVTIVCSITKYAVTVLDPLSIRYHLEKAVYLARSGRPGPVWIDIPLDVQGAPIDPEALAGFDPVELPSESDATPLRQSVDETIRAFNRSERPVIFAGNGVRLANAANLLDQAARFLGAPVELTWCAGDLLADNDPLFVGRPGSIAARGANFALQNADFLLAIGVRLDMALTGFAPERLARGAHKVMVDVDSAEIAKMGDTIQTRVVADAGDFLRELLTRRDEIQPKDRSAWNSRCQEWKRRYPVVQPEHRVPIGRVSAYNFAEVVSEAVLPDDCIVSGSSGSGIEIFLLAYRTRKGQRVFHTAGLGAMGFALPSAIGVCLAHGRRRTVCVDGDGGFQFNIQELETVSRLQLPIKFFVLNNDGYSSIRASQSNYFGGACIGCDAATGLTIPDIRKVAESYRLCSAEISTQQNLLSDVRRILDIPGPVVCDVKVIPEEFRGPRLASVRRPDGSFVSRPLEDLFPFLDRDEFRSNMLVPVIEE